MKRILIANRGEIAARIARTAKLNGYCVIGIARKSDLNDPYLSFMDEIYTFESDTVQESFLSATEIIKGAKKHSANFIHPGYGFLSESAAFASEVEKANIKFVGPDSRALNLLGNKIEARILADKSGVPIIKGFRVPETLTLNDSALPEGITFPSMIKAGAGGGGRGMRIVRSADELQPLLIAASDEAKRAFGDGTLFLEKFIDDAKHIEVQILRDMHGNCIHLFERDCSYQRRFQKILEFAPSSIPQKVKEKLFASAKLIAEAGGLTNAATMEFLFEPKTGNYYFLECNPRLQVEHTVTEEITGVDIVALQLAIAEGETLPPQEVFKSNGCAIQARICGEVPERNFAVETGQIKNLAIGDASKTNPVVKQRNDFSYEENSKIGIDFDSLLGKVIVHAQTEELARESLLYALSRSRITGIETNIPYLLNIMRHSPLLDAARISTLNELGETLIAKESAFELKDIAIALYQYLLESYTRISPNAFHSRYRGPELSAFPLMQITISHFELKFRTLIPENLKNECKFTPNSKSEIEIRHDDRKYIAILKEGPEINGSLMALINGYWIEVQPVNESDSDSSQMGFQNGEIESPLPGIVIRIGAKKGSVTDEGELLLSFESMKTEHSILAPYRGTTTELLVKVGDRLERGTPLIKFEKVPDNTN